MHERPHSPITVRSLSRGEETVDGLKDQVHDQEQICWTRWERGVTDISFSFRDPCDVYPLLLTEG